MITPSRCRVGSTAGASEHPRLETRVVNMADSLTEPVCLEDFESYAREYLPYYAFQFFAGGANEETTIRENLEAFKRCENMGREQQGPGVKYRSHSTGQDYYWSLLHR